MSGDNHYLTALDATSGEMRWHFGTNQWLNMSPILSSDRKVVYVGERFSLGDYLYAVDATSGEELWQYREGSTYVYTLATLADGALIAGWGNGRVYGFASNATTPTPHPRWHGNSVAWQINMGTDFSSESAAVHADGTLAVNLISGKVVAMQLAVQ